MGDYRQRSYARGQSYQAPYNSSYEKRNSEYFGPAVPSDYFAPATPTPLGPRRPSNSNNIFPATNANAAADMFSSGAGLASGALPHAFSSSAAVSPFEFKDKLSLQDRSSFQQQRQGNQFQQQQQQRQQQQPQYSLGSGELDHVNGLTTRFLNMFHVFPSFSPGHPSASPSSASSSSSSITAVYAVGNAAAVAPISEEQRRSSSVSASSFHLDVRLQQLLERHDHVVSALDVSPCGTLVATGQVGSSSVRGAPAAVVVWSVDLSSSGSSSSSSSNENWRDELNNKPLRELRGLFSQVLWVKFSPDARFLAAADVASNFVVWNVEAGEVR